MLKTFPVSGGETLDESRMVEDDLDPLLRLFRKVCNHQTKREFERLMHASTGHIVLLAGGGSHDTVTADRRRRDAPVRPHHPGDDRPRRSRRSVVVPLFVDYGPDASLVDFGTPRNVADPDDVHAVGEEIAAAGQPPAPGGTRGPIPRSGRFAGTIRYRTD